MFSDRSDANALSDGESLELLASASIGRIAYSDRALPFVVPVKFVLDGMDIVIRTSRTSALAANVPGNVVAFEADDLGSPGESGWSVVVTGRALLVADAVDVARLTTLPLQGSPSEEADCYLRLRADVINGCRTVGAAELVSSRPAVPTI
jgi:nitroimidazol reductase NimA-like FMN-containing flavoprotein (pyridoxamine 5'-phosphate oxidase superfamily)